MPSAARLLPGKVDSLSPATGAQFALLPPDNATGNFTKVVQRVPVKIVFDADSVRGFEDRIRPGLVRGGQCARAMKAFSISPLPRSQVVLALALVREVALPSGSPRHANEAKLRRQARSQVQLGNEGIRPPSFPRWSDSPARRRARPRPGLRTPGRGGRHPPAARALQERPRRPPLLPPRHTTPRQPDGAWWHIFRDAAHSTGWKTPPPGQTRICARRSRVSTKPASRLAPPTAGFLPTVESNVELLARVRTTNSNPDGRAEHRRQSRRLHLDLRRRRQRHDHRHDHAQRPPARLHQPRAFLHLQRLPRAPEHFLRTGRIRPRSPRLRQRAGRGTGRRGGSPGRRAGPERGGRAGVF